MKIKKAFLRISFLLLVLINSLIIYSVSNALPWECTTTFATVAVYVGGGCSEGHWSYGCRETVKCNGALYSETVFYVADGYDEWTKASIMAWC